MKFFVIIISVMFCINMWSKLSIHHKSASVIDLDSMEYEAMSGAGGCYQATSVLRNFVQKDNKFILIDYEYSPTITLHKGNYIGTYESPCSESEKEFDKVVVMVNRFDVFNIYEMFHSLINTYILLKLFSLEGDNFTILFVDDAERTALNDDMFGVFTSDLVYGDKKTCYKFKKGVLKSSAEFTSILVTKHGVLKGRGSNHHCRSALLREFVSVVKDHFGVPHDDGHYLKKEGGPSIIWSSRGVHRRGNSVKEYKPSRMLLDEDKFLNALRKSTGHSITSIDFGHLTAEQSIRVVSGADIMIGMHGAGLMWSAFLPRHGGLVEIFGADRGPHNRHYHNVASLSDLHYSDIRPGSLLTVARNLKWNGGKTFLRQVIESVEQVKNPEEEPT